MVAIREKGIVNLKRFQNDIDRKISNIHDFDVNIVCPMLKNQALTISKPHSLDEVKTMILDISKKLPHRKCAVTYKISENSSLEIQIQPVTETA